MKLTAERLVAEAWARPVSAFSTPGPYRKIDQVRRQVSYGIPELLITFTNGDVVHTRPADRWEIDMELDQ